MKLPKRSEIFNIEIESRELKALLSKYDPEAFIRSAADLIRYIGSPIIPFYPFQGLDSPLRQLYYITRLNLSADPDLITEAEVSTDEEWKEIVVRTIRSKPGILTFFCLRKMKIRKNFEISIMSRCQFL